MEKRSLDQIGVSKRTDKSSLLHGYLEYYEKEFPNPENVKCILEIGLQRGGKWRTNDVSPSIEMWKEFFPNARILGADIKSLKFSDKRTEFIRIDQNEPDDLVRLFNFIPEEIDLILDDGSHKPSHQLTTFLVLFPKIKVGGKYIIEDLNAVVQQNYPEQERILSLIHHFLNQNQLSFRWVPSVSSGGRSSIVITKTS